MAELLTDDEINLVHERGACLPDLVGMRKQWPEIIRFARAIESAVLTKLRPDQPHGMPAGISWNGFNLQGNAASVKEVQRLMHREQFLDVREQALYAANAEIARLREALADIETATNYSPHRAAGTWDENLAKLIHAHARLLPGALAESATTGAGRDV